MAKTTKLKSRPKIARPRTCFSCGLDLTAQRTQVANPLAKTGWPVAFQTRNHGFQPKTVTGLRRPQAMDLTITYLPGSGPARTAIRSYCGKCAPLVWSNQEALGSLMNLYAVISGMLDARDLPPGTVPEAQNWSFKTENTDEADEGP